MPAKTLSLFSLSAKIPDESAAVAFFERARWGDTPVCPHCEGKDTSPRPSRHGHLCRSCRKDFTVRIGTVMQESKLPLRKWLFAMYLIQTARKGISAMQLSKELEVSYSAAWFLGHRIRAGCVPMDGELLDGIVEADETYIGGLDINRHEHKKTKAMGTNDKMAVVGFRERGPGGRAVAFPVPDTKKATLMAALRAKVSVNATLMTDESLAYAGADETFYLHHTVCHSAKEYVVGMAHVNGLESMWAVLKRAWRGTFHWWSLKHLHLYTSEIAFRLGQGNVRVDTVDRMTALAQGMVGKRLSYRQLVRGA